MGLACEQQTYFRSLPLPELRLLFAGLPWGSLHDCCRKPNLSSHWFEYASLWSKLKTRDLEGGWEINVEVHDVGFNNPVRNKLFGWRTAGTRTDNVLPDVYQSSRHWPNCHSCMQTAGKSLMLNLASWVCSVVDWRLKNTTCVYLTIGHFKHERHCFIGKNFMLAHI